MNFVIIVATAYVPMKAEGAVVFVPVVTAKGSGKVGNTEWKYACLFPELKH
jgi:hypothetical protein